LVPVFYFPIGRRRNLEYRAAPQNPQIGRKVQYKGCPLPTSAFRAYTHSYMAGVHLIEMVDLRPTFCDVLSKVF
jgi:hypothetical protein